MAETQIEWTDATWNPVAGCSIVTEGCTHCYAMEMAKRLEAMGVEKYAGLTRKMQRIARHVLGRGDDVLVVGANGDKHVLAVVEGATENTVVVQALIDNLLARGLDPTLPRLFIVDGAKALSKAIRNTFGVAAAIQRCQVHKGRNIIERLPQHLHASVKKALRQAWDQDDANKAERLLRNLARRLEHEEPGVSGSILEGLEEILTVIRLGLPHELRRSLACTNIIENALGTVRQVTRNVKRWRHAEMALRWTAAGLLEAQKTFRRLKAYRQLPILRNALQEHLRKAQADSAIETIMKAA